MSERTIPLHVTEDLRRAVPLLRALLELVDAYDKVGSIEQAVDESNARLARARAFEGEYKAQLLAERDEIAALRATAADAVAQAERDAKNIVEAAHTRAAQVEADVQAQVAGHTAELEAKLAELGRLADEFLVAREQLASVRAQADEFKDAVASKKEELRKLLGG